MPGYSKEQQLYSRRIKPTQKQMGDISTKVRKEVRERSGGVCEVRVKCNGARAMEQAHITGRKQLNHKTTAEDLLDSCVECHRWLDNTPEGIRYRRSMRAG
ncbi:hypothetical protein D3C76_1383960 [compost metagenome]